MKYYAGVTDNDWFNFLRRERREDINFWQPSGTVPFKVLKPGDPFLFKLKKPYNAIGGVGFFSTHSFLPLSLAWDAFGERNGVESYPELLSKIATYRKKTGKPSHPNPTIGAIVLNSPIFFNEEDWIPAPGNWGGVVQGRSYDTNTQEGRDLWERVEETLAKYQPQQYNLEAETSNLNNYHLAEPEATYRRAEVKVRVGQGAFRILITDAYGRRCSMSGERTLPVLEAAHIQPFAMGGPHRCTNGILMRSDLHRLFDTGYITITPGYKIEVSSRIKEEFSNGKDYYAYHGKDLLVLPDKEEFRPGNEYLSWHNENVFL